MCALQPLRTQNVYKPNSSLSDNGPPENIYSANNGDYIKMLTTFFFSLINIEKSKKKKIWEPLKSAGPRLGPQNLTTYRRPIVVCITDVTQRVSGYFRVCARRAARGAFPFDADVW